MTDAVGSVGEPITIGVGVGGKLIGVGVGGKVIAVGVGGNVMGVGVSGKIIGVGEAAGELQAAASRLTVTTESASK